jgi:peptidoglycan hydrolase CwlO-like protein
MVVLAAAGSSAVSDIGYVALVASAFFVLFGARSNQSRKDLSDSVNALQGRLDAKQDEISDLEKKVDAQEALNASLMQQTSDLRSSVETLQNVVTSRDLITTLHEMTRNGFIAQGVPPEKLASAGNGNGKDRK